MPANHAFRGRYVPRVMLRTTYFYIDPVALAVDSELELSHIDFSPRLFFDDPALWSTAEKLSAIIETPANGCTSIPSLRGIR